MTPLLISEPVASLLLVSIPLGHRCPFRASVTSHKTLSVAEKQLFLTHWALLGTVDICGSYFLGPTNLSRMHNVSLNEHLAVDGFRDELSQSTLKIAGSTGYQIGCATAVAVGRGLYRGAARCLSPHVYTIWLVSVIAPTIYTNYTRPK